MNAAPRRRTLVALLSVGVLAAGCGGTNSPSALLESAVSHIGEIRAGNLLLRFTLTPNNAANSAVGMTMRGGFALDRHRALPIIHFTYTQLAGAQSKTAEIASDGRVATITTGGRSAPLNAAQRQALAATLQGPQGLGNLQLHLDRWVLRPHRTTGPTIAGQPTYEVTGEVNLRAVLDDINHLTGARISSARPDSTGGALTKVLRSSSFRATVGRNDQLLRQLYVRAVLAPSSPASVGPATAGVTIAFNLEITPRPRSR